MGNLEKAESATKKGLSEQEWQERKIGWANKKGPRKTLVSKLERVEWATTQGLSGSSERVGCATKKRLVSK